MYGDKNKINVSIKLDSGDIDTNSVALCTGVKSEANEISFGDKIGDGVVCLHNYHPMLEVDGEYRELEV
jgi:hypothetical protein